MRRPRALGEHEQLGVEEPAVVAHRRAAGARATSRADGLEAALRVAEARARASRAGCGCSAREISSRLGPRMTRAPARQARADREVAVAGEQRRDERQQRAQVGREVDVHVADDASRRSPPTRRAARGRGPSRAAAARSTPGSSSRQPAAIVERAVGARVVGDHDPPAEREARARGSACSRWIEVASATLLVVDRDDDLDLRRTPWPCPGSGRGAGRGALRSCHRASGGRVGTLLGPP